MTEDRKVEFEYAVTHDGCTVGRNSRGEPEALYWSDPPEGDGWRQFGGFQSANGDPYTVWRRWRRQEPEIKWAAQRREHQAPSAKAECLETLRVVERPDGHHVEEFDLETGAHVQNWPGPFKTKRAAELFMDDLAGRPLTAIPTTPAARTESLKPTRRRSRKNCPSEPDGAGQTGTPL